MVVVRMADEDDIGFGHELIAWKLVGVDVEVVVFVGGDSHAVVLKEFKIQVFIMHWLFTHDMIVIDWRFLLIVFKL